MRRAPVARSTAAPQQLSEAVEAVRVRELRTFWGCDLETGRLPAPRGREAIAEYVANMKARRGHPELQHEQYLEGARNLPKATTTAKLHAVLQHKEEHSGITLSQVRRAAPPVTWPTHQRCRGRGCYCCGYTGQATSVPTLCEGCRTLDPSKWPCTCRDY